MKTWFTSDWHLGDDRINIPGQLNLMMRPFSSVSAQDDFLMWKFVSSNFKNGDTLYHLGDAIHTPRPWIPSLLKRVRNRFPDSKFVLVMGNYDTVDKLGLLDILFDERVDSAAFELGDYWLELNHYPAKLKPLIDDLFRVSKKIDSGKIPFGVTGHIHSLWKVQENMVNVGVDAWHFLPVSEDELKFIINACLNHYDNNVFLK